MVDTTAVLVPILRTEQPYREVEDGPSDMFDALCLSASLVQVGVLGTETARGPRGRKGESRLKISYAVGCRRVGTVFSVR